MKKILFSSVMALALVLGLAQNFKASGSKAAPSSLEQQAIQAANACTQGYHGPNRHFEANLVSIASCIQPYQSSILTYEIWVVYECPNNGPGPQNCLPIQPQLLGTSVRDCEGNWSATCS